MPNIDIWDELAALIKKGDHRALDAFFNELSPTDTALAISRLDEGDRISLLTLLLPHQAVGILGDLPNEQAADLIGEMKPAEAAAIVDLMPADEGADLLGDISAGDAEAILGAMAIHDAARVRRLMDYPKGTAGALMDMEFLAFPGRATVGAVQHDFQRNAARYSDYEVQYVYVTDDDGALAGVLRIRDLLLQSADKRIDEFMIKTPVAVSTNVPLADLVELFVEHPSFLGVPVVDEAGHLIGILRRHIVVEAEGDDAEHSFLKSSGIIGGEEFRSMPLRQRAVRRLAWLCPNILLNIIAASVIAVFQDTLQAVIALAVFLPIISDMSGCSGNQAVAVSIRELALGLIKPKEFARVFSKEAGLGLFNGCFLGLLLGGLAYVWKSNIYLSLVIASALILNTLLAVLIGGSIPLLLRKLKIDPALASGPLLTTITDMCGFFFVLGFASLLLDHLT